MALIDNLIYSYELTEASGNATDAHGAGPSLADINTVGSGTMLGGNARDFELDNSEMLSVADTAIFDGSDADFTLEVWVKPESLAATMAILGKWIDPNYEYLIYFVTPSNYFTFIVRDAADNYASAASAASVSPGSIYQIVVWHNATANQIGIRVNDGNQATTSFSGGVYTGTGGFAIGGFYDARGSFYDGLLKYHRRWSRVLSGDEITSLYNSGSGLSYASLVTATAFTLSGPSAGPANAASTSFTVTPNSIYSGTFTPDTISGVSYSPSSLTWSGASDAKTFTVNKTAAGTVNINGTCSPSLTQPSNVSYTAKATTTKPYTVQDGIAATTTYFTIKNSDGTNFGGRTSTGVTEIGGGVYYVASATVPSDLVGVIYWDQGGSAVGSQPLDNSTYINQVVIRRGGTVMRM